nr:hypothetical protein [Pandoravirus massiliensis]
MYCARFCCSQRDRAITWGGSRPPTRAAWVATAPGCPHLWRVSRRGNSDIADFFFIMREKKRQGHIAGADRHQSRAAHTPMAVCPLSGFLFFWPLLAGHAQLAERKRTLAVVRLCGAPANSFRRPGSIKRHSPKGRGCLCSFFLWLDGPAFRRGIFFFSFTIHLFLRLLFLSLPPPVGHDEARPCRLDRPLFMPRPAHLL